MRTTIAPRVLFKNLRERRTARCSRCGRRRRPLHVTPGGGTVCSGCLR